MTVNERQRIEAAKEALIRATEALLLPSISHRAAALLWAGIAVVHLARSDGNEAVLELVTDQLERVKGVE